ncbi:MAG: hypothetical protein IRZ15_11275 [Bryobacteraceae bacterium]|nr:hypothetical protein [Bryobacteraceae bacterium]
MKCPVESKENVDLLLDFCLGKPGAAAARLARHVEACPACQEFCASCSALWSDLDLLEAPPVSPDFNRRLYERIEAEESGVWRKFLSLFRLRWMRPATAVAAAGMLVVFGVLLQSPFVPENLPRPLMEAKSDIDIEQIEETLEDLEMLRTLPVVISTESPASL